MKRFLKRLWSFIKVLFTNPETYIEKYIMPSIEVVQMIKTAVDSPIALILTELIPTNVDDYIRANISNYLGLIMEGFTMGADVLDSKDNQEEKVAKFVNWLKTLSPVLRSAIYAKLASKLSQQMAGEFIAGAKNHSIDLLTQLTYSKLKSGVNENELAPVQDKILLDIPRAL